MRFGINNNNIMNLERIKHEDLCRDLIKKNFAKNNKKAMTSLPFLAMTSPPLLDFTDRNSPGYEI